MCQDGRVEMRMETTGGKELVRWVLSWMLDVVSCGQVVLFKILRFGCLGTTGDHAEGVGSFVHIGEIEYDRKISRVVRGPGSASARIPVPNTFGRAIPIRSPNHDGMFISTELGSHNGLHKRKHGPRPHREIKFRLSEQDTDGLGSSVRRRSPQRFVLGQIPHFQALGFVKVPGALTPEEIDEFSRRFDVIIEKGKAQK